MNRRYNESTPRGSWQHWTRIAKENRIKSFHKVFLTKFPRVAYQTDRKNGSVEQRQDIEWAKACQCPLIDESEKGSKTADITAQSESYRSVDWPENQREPCLIAYMLAGMMSEMSLMVLLINDVECYHCGEVRRPNEFFPKE